MVIQGSSKNNGVYSVLNLQHDTLFLGNGKTYFQLQLTIAKENLKKQVNFSSAHSFFEPSSNFQFLTLGSISSELKLDQIEWQILKKQNMMELEGVGLKQRIFLRYSVNEPN